MTRPFGWCAAPDGARPQHAACPGVIGGLDGIRCGCTDVECGCIERGIAAIVETMEATTQDGPGDSLRKQRAEVPGPRPTPLGAPN